jgi:hypothetical protein
MAGNGLCVRAGQIDFAALSAKGDLIEAQVIPSGLYLSVG